MMSQRNGLGRVYHKTEGESLTEQAHKDSVDLKTILRSHRGPAPELDPSKFGDFTVTELQDALNLVDEAQREFLSLPVEVRKAYDHNPVALVEAMRDPRGHAILAEHGLATEEAVGTTAGGDVKTGAPAPEADGADTPPEAEAP